MGEGSAGNRHSDVDAAVVFRVSTYSGGGNCVEVGALPGGGAVLRDSKDPLRRGRVALDRAQWDHLLSAIKSGAFDRYQPR